MPAEDSKLLRRDLSHRGDRFTLQHTDVVATFGNSAASVDKYARRSSALMLTFAMPALTAAVRSALDRPDAPCSA